MFDRVKDVGHPEEEMLSVYREYGVIRKSARDDNTNQTAENRNIYQLVDDGWLIVNRMKAWQGSVGISRFRGIVSGHYLCFRPKHSEDPRYLNWLLRSDVYANEYASMSRGVRPGQIEIDNDELRGLRIALPSLDEQRRIADFLDAETRRIDRMAELRSLQLDMLDERSRGELSSVAEDLGFWHGTIKVRHVLQRIEQGWSPQCEDRMTSEGEWGVVKAGCINGGHFGRRQHKALPVNVKPDRRFHLKPGDLLMSRASGSVELIGSVGVLPSDLPPRLLLCDKVYRLEMDRTRMDPRFVALMLSTAQVREQIKLGISGADGMANNLPTGTVTNLSLPDVPLAKQAGVVEDLEDRRKAAQRTRQLLSDQLALLGERRQALITAAVTGQFDVATARGVKV
jgi:type I restriction enzyme S subunit